MDFKKQLINYYDIDKESFKCSEPTLYEIMWDGVKFEILINYCKTSEYATVFVTGNVNRTICKQLPVFSRARWMDDFTCTTIWYFDPTLYLKNDISLAWYYGTNKRWYLKDIAELIKIILSKLDIKINNTLFYGSSGGGFSSIMLATMFHGKATVINPQFDATKYYDDTLKTLSECVLNEGEELIIERLNAADFINKEKFFPTLHVFCNIQSKKDAKVQIPTFLSNCFDYNIDCTEHFKIDFYYNSEGHGGMPEKADCIQHIENDVRSELPMRVSLDSHLKNDHLVINVKTEPEYQDTEYEYHLFGSDSTSIHKRKIFSTTNSYSFVLSESGTYTVVVYVRHKNSQTGLYSYYKVSAEHEYKSLFTANINTTLKQNKLSVFVDATTDFNQIEYACYLYSAENSLPVIKTKYQQSPYFDFELTEQGKYYAKVFLKMKNDTNNDTNDELIISKFTPEISYSE